MTEFPAEVTDIPRAGGEKITSNPAPVPESLGQISPAAQSAIRGETNPQPNSAAQPMTLEQKALTPTPSEILSPKAISAIQGKTS